jgi:hypothetical protein
MNSQRKGQGVLLTMLLVQWKFQRSQITITDVPHIKDIAVTELKLI